MFLPHSNTHVIIMGAGPAGITAAVELARHNIVSCMIEKNNQPGGLARTIQYKGYRFDIGGHRFYTKLPRIQQWWEDVLGEDFLRRQRKSRILYRRRHLDYPLRLTNLLTRLGPLFCFRAAMSYLAAVIRPRRPEVSFEDWITNRFGGLLFRAFFKSYTEKVWGISCSCLSAAWAAQRIKGLGFASVVLSLLYQSRKRPIKSLIRQFHYPRLGPGQMWEKAVASLPSDHAIHYGQDIIAVACSENRIVSITTRSAAGDICTYSGEYFLSSIAMRDLIRAMGKAVPEHIQSAAEKLGYRDFITVALIIDVPDINSDNWLYIHDENVRVGRIQNFKNWSPDMVPDAATTCLGLEYFCFKGDDLWSLDDEALIALAKHEIAMIGLVESHRVTDASVVRVEQAYPVYDANYQAHVTVVREFLGRFHNLQLIGRNGMHRYNNQDHAMMTAMLAVENIMGANHNIWEVNNSGTYGEE